MKVNFKLPNTRLCIVITFRDNIRTEHLIPTPSSNDDLRMKMLVKHIGYGDIKAVKAVDGESLVNQMTRCRRA